MSTIVNEIRSKFVTSRADNELKLKISDIIGLDHGRLDDWFIRDRVHDLVLIQRNPDVSDLTHIRGIIVNTTTKSVVADSLGFEDHFYSDKITLVDGQLSLTVVSDHALANQYAKPFVCDKDDLVILPGLEGIFIRIFVVDGELCISSYSKIDARKTRRCSSEVLLEKYERAKGPTAEQLFGDVQNSTDFYSFILCDKDFCKSSKLIFKNKTFLVFLGKNNVLDGVYHEDYPKDLCSSSDIFTFDGEGILFAKGLTLDEANQFLSHGNYANNYVGESLMLVKLNHGKVERIIKAMSLIYSIHAKIRGEGEGIKADFYDRLNDAYDNFDLADNCREFTLKYVPYSAITELELLNRMEEYGAVNYLDVGEWEESKIFSSHSRLARMRIIWLNFVVSVSPSYQLEAIEIFSQYFSAKKALCKLLHLLYHNRELISERVYNSRTCSRLRACIKQMEVLDGRRKLNSKDKRDYIRNFIENEKPSSVYFMSKLREVKEYLK